MWTPTVLVQREGFYRNCGVLILVQSIKTAFPSRILLPRVCSGVGWNRRITLFSVCRYLDLVPSLVEVPTADQLFVRKYFSKYFTIIAGVEGFFVGMYICIFNFVLPWAPARPLFFSALTLTAWHALAPFRRVREEFENGWKLLTRDRSGCIRGFTDRIGGNNYWWMFWRKLVYFPATGWGGPLWEWSHPIYPPAPFLVYLFVFIVMHLIARCYRFPHMFFSFGSTVISD